MSNEYGVGYIEQWQGYEVPNNKTVQELEAEMQQALANAGSAGIDADGNVYVDSNGNLILPSRSIIGYLHIRDATIDSANIAVAAIGTAHIQRAAITTALISDGSIIDAKIVDLAANKISAGTIDTGEVFLQGPKGKLRITGNRVQVFDTNSVPRERVSMGDVWGDGTVYGFLMRAADGQTVMMDWTGVKSAGITDGAITNPKIGEGAVRNNNIYANTITGDRLVANAITAREIMAGAVTATMITTGTLKGVNIEGVTIKGSTIDGGTFRSADWGTSFTVTPGQMLLHNTSNGSYVRTQPTGIVGYDSTREKWFELNTTFVETEAIRTTNKNVYLVSGYSAVSNTYGEIRCVKNYGVPGNGAIEDYYYADLRAATIVSNGAYVITTATINDYAIDLNDVNEWTSKWFHQKNGYILSTEPELVLWTSDYSSWLQLGTDQTGAFVKAQSIAYRSYTGNANTYVTTNGTLGMVGSAAKFKLNIKDLPESEFPKVLQLRPRVWHDRVVVEETARYLDQVAATDKWGNEALVINEPGKQADIRPIERIPGLIAEEVESLGLSDFVVYSDPDEEGHREIQSVMYDRLWIPLVPIIRELVEKVRILEENAS